MQYSLMHTLWKAGAMVTFSILLAGCGQRGPLYLPDVPTLPAAAAPPAAEAPAADATQP